MDQAHTTQKRRFPRYKFEARLNIGVLRGTAPQDVKGYCMVLGEGGARIRTDEPLSVDEIVYLQIPLPVRPLRLPASVRHQHGHDYGMEFLALGVTEREYIRSACSALPRVG